MTASISAKDNPVRRPLQQRKAVYFTSNTGTGEW